MHRVFESCSSRCSRTRVRSASPSQGWHGRSALPSLAPKALRLQRGAEEVRVYVRLPEDERDAIADIEALIVQAPSGERVPLTHVAALSMGTSPPTIRRKDGQARVVTVTADVDDSVITGGEANAVLEDSILAELTASNPELTYSFGGEQQQQLESLDSLYRGFMLAMLVIFALLAIALASYGRPFNRHGDRAVRIDRRDPWAPGAWRRAERGVPSLASLA